MKHSQFEVRTSSRNEMVNVTRQVASAIGAMGIRDGLCVVYVPHTTASVTVNEGWDPAVMEDITEYLDERIPWKASYRHSEGNSAAHIKASLFGHSAQIPVRGGKLVMGRWQAIFFCEFDGPRTRQVEVNFIEG
jgi:secondary thiamine-phosphate synthase enzyme